MAATTEKTGIRLASPLEFESIMPLVSIDRSLVEKLCVLSMDASMNMSDDISVKIPLSSEFVLTAL
jgi:hypothetical protein